MQQKSRSTPPTMGDRVRRVIFMEIRAKSSLEASVSEWLSEDISGDIALLGGEQIRLFVEEKADEAKFTMIFAIPKGFEKTYRELEATKISTTLRDRFGGTMDHRVLKEVVTLSTGLISRVTNVSTGPHKHNSAVVSPRSDSPMTGTESDKELFANAFRREVKSSIRPKTTPPVSISPRVLPSPRDAASHSLDTSVSPRQFPQRVLTPRGPTRRAHKVQASIGSANDLRNHRFAKPRRIKKHATMSAGDLRDAKGILRSQSADGRIHRFSALKFPPYGYPQSASDREQHRQSITHMFKAGVDWKAKAMKLHRELEAKEKRFETAIADQHRMRIMLAKEVSDSRERIRSLTKCAETFELMIGCVLKRNRYKRFDERWARADQHGLAYSKHEIRIKNLSSKDMSDMAEEAVTKGSLDHDDGGLLFIPLAFIFKVHRDAKKENQFHVTAKFAGQTRTFVFQTSKRTDPYADQTTRWVNLIRHFREKHLERLQPSSNENKKEGKDRSSLNPPAPALNPNISKSLLTEESTGPLNTPQSATDVLGSAKLLGEKFVLPGARESEFSNGPGSYTESKGIPGMGEKTRKKKRRPSHRRSGYMDLRLAAMGPEDSDTNDLGAGAEESDVDAKLKEERENLPAKFGLLSKKNRFSRWDPRWVLVFEHAMFYSKNRAQVEGLDTAQSALSTLQGGEAKRAFERSTGSLLECANRTTEGVVKIGMSVISRIQISDDHPNRFHVRFSHKDSKSGNKSGGEKRERLMRFHCNSETEAMEWVAVLNKHLESFYSMRRMMRLKRNLIPEIPLSLMCCTWNVNAKRPEVCLESWLKPPEGIQPNLYCIALQEITKFTTRSVATDVDTSFTWRLQIEKTLLPRGYVKVISQHLVGLVIIIYAQERILSYISDVSTKTIAAGVMGVGGNKGAVGVELRVFRSKVSFVNCHLAAHQEKIKQRNQNLQKISKRLQLDSPDNDLVVLMGDLNYRLNISDKSIVEQLIERKDWSLLLNNDQLLQERSKGLILSDYKEGPINFAPTFKFEIGTNHYETKKQRIPSWCDRILWRTSRQLDKDSVRCYRYDADFSYKISDHKPVWALLSLMATQPTQLSLIGQMLVRQLNIESKVLKAKLNNSPTPTSLSKPRPPSLTHITSPKAAPSTPRGMATALMSSAGRDKRGRGRSMSAGPEDMRRILEGRRNAEEGSMRDSRKFRRQEDGTLLKSLKSAKSSSPPRSRGRSNSLWVDVGNPNLRRATSTSPMRRRRKRFTFTNLGSPSTGSTTDVASMSSPVERRPKLQPAGSHPGSVAKLTRNMSNNAKWNLAHRRHRSVASDPMEMVPRKQARYSLLRRAIGQLPQQQRQSTDYTNINTDINQLVNERGTDSRRVSGTTAGTIDSPRVSTDVAISPRQSGHAADGALFLGKNSLSPLTPRGKQLVEAKVTTMQHFPKPTPPKSPKRVNIRIGD
ncbi:hypothetical protein AAMO2058_000721900 [Amorphochlora amoebiformis]|uniref:PH domain-containing protein n=1 Tax=Amorphochlora amoebiformis TaxID=1561963 RepID=A0A7S0H6H3_9EUKA